MALVKAAICCLLALSAYATGAKVRVSEDGPKGGNVQIAGSLNINGDVSAPTLTTGKLTAKGDVSVSGAVTAESASSKSLVAESLSTGILTSPSGTVVINGDLHITNSKTKQDAQAVALIAEEVIIRGVRQWSLVRHETFDDGNTEGWSAAQYTLTQKMVDEVPSFNNTVSVSSCRSGGADKFLGGHCNIGAGEVRKTFTNLPPHSRVRVTGRYHFIDNWRGETGFAKLNGELVWADTALPEMQNGSPLGGLNICGNPKFPEFKFSTPIDVTIPHTDNNIMVSFGSTGLLEQDPCERSFGVDDVQVYVL